MATSNYSSGKDFIIPSNTGSTYRGLGGDDIYIVSNNTLTPNAQITIVDTAGTNKIQFVEGMVISSTLIAKDALQMTFENNAVLTINGANNFIYDIGGNATQGKQGDIFTYNEVVDILFNSKVPQDSSINNGRKDVDIISILPSSVDLTSPSSGSSIGIINFSSSTNFVIANQYLTYRGLGGDDTYIISKATINSGAKITIVDSVGTNKIQLVKDLVISSTLIASDAIRMTFPNGAQLTINGADKFIFDVGGNATLGEQGRIYTFSELVINFFETEIPEGDNVNDGQQSITVSSVSSLPSETETSTTSSVNSFSISLSKTNIDEGGSVIVTIASNNNVSEDTKFSWIVSGDNNDSTVEKASNDDISVRSGIVTIPSGKNSATFSIEIKSDDEDEPLEGLAVEVTKSNDNAIIGKEIFLISDVKPQSLDGTDGDDIITLTSLDDTYRMTSGDDYIDAGDGYDTIEIPQGYIVVSVIDVKGNVTGVIDKPYLLVSSEDDDGNSFLTFAINFEEIKTDGAAGAISTAGYYSKSRYDVSTDQILTDKSISDNESITIDLSNHFYTINAKAELSYTFTLDNDKISDQILISGSTLDIQGGVGGDKYTADLTIRATQEFSDGFKFSSDEFFWEEVTIKITLSDDDYLGINAVNDANPDPSGITTVVVTEDIRGGVLLNLVSLDIDRGSIEVNYYGPNDTKYNPSPDGDFIQFSDYFTINENVLKLKDDVVFDVDRSVLINLETRTYTSGKQTDGTYEIKFSYTSSGSSKTHILKINNFLDTLAGPGGIKGDNKYIRFGESGFTKSSSAAHLQSSYKYTNSKDINSDEVELTYVFVPANAQCCR